MSATELANASKSILDHVIASGERAEVQRHGRTVAEVVPMPGVNRAEFLRRLRGAELGKAAQREMREAMEAANEVFGYAGSSD